MPPGVGLPQGGMQDDPTMPPGAVSIQVTPEEKEAIERVSIGYISVLVSPWFQASNALALWKIEVII